MSEVIIKYNNGTTEEAGFNWTNPSYAWDDNDSNYATSTAGENEIDILSNGFKLRATDAPINTNAALYVGIAIAEQPSKYSNSR